MIRQKNLLIKILVTGNLNCLFLMIVFRGWKQNLRLIQVYLNLLSYDHRSLLITARMVMHFSEPLLNSTLLQLWSEAAFRKA